MAELADHAHAHACAVLGAGDAAVEAAITAVRRGGRSRSAVLGHARACVLDRAGDESGGPDLDAPAPDDLTALAVALAATRPAIERVVVDLEGRHSLDRGAFARALGLPMAVAGARAAAVSAEWQHLLDPVVLAHLGSGGCDELAALLDRPLRSSVPDPSPNSQEDAVLGEDATDVVTLRELMQLGPIVSDHAAGCESCGDRLRSMVSVRTLLAQRPVEGTAPAAVRAAAAPTRLRLPTPPPPLEPERLTRRWMRPVAAVSAALLVAITGGVVAAAIQDDEPSRDQVDALTRVPTAGSVLVVSPPVLEGTTPPPVVLTNRSGAAIAWVAAADVTWLQIAPAQGTLEPGSETELRVGVTSAAPEGPARGAVRISGADGSAAVVRLSTTVERPPEVAATAAGCDISVTVEDEGEVRAVELHSVEGEMAERVVALAVDDAGYTGRLANGGTNITWWVTASDARGNVARTPDNNVAPNTCP